MARKDAGADARRDASPNETSPNVRSNRWFLAGIAVVVIAACAVIKSATDNPPAEAQSPRPNSQRQPAPQQTSRPVAPQDLVAAVVNGQDINNQQLAQACVERFGEDVLESLVNKQLIEHHCRKRGITITEADLEAEVDRVAKRFKLGREQWLELLKNERGVEPQEYKYDILWPTIALRRLAGSQISVSAEELRKSYETQYGPMVRVRLIVVSTGKRAEEIHRLLQAQPDKFARVAMQESQDVNSASIGGLIQPVRLHAGNPLVEQAAFAMQPGEVSNVIPIAADQFVLLKCEGHLEPRNVPIEEVRSQLEEAIREEKLRGVAGDLFEKLQNSATIQNVYNDPQLHQAMPGVVATVNGEQITMRQLGQECLKRHGEAVLEGEISRTLLQQEMKRSNLTVTQADLEAEMAHAAELAGVTNAAGEADLAQWIEITTKEQDVDYEVYLRDSVWPSAALKKITGNRVQVTDEDLQKGFDANYGERVRCRAIVVASMRRAQEVWAKARENTSVEYFSDLAAEYSIEPTSKTLRGEVPPIQRHSGQPQLENAAFSLRAGEMSGVVQVGDKFVILKCEGRTTPVQVDMAEVRELLYQDLFEKKLRIAMAETFQEIQDRARIDNYLAGTSKAPPAKQAGQPRRDSAVKPTSGVR